MTEEHGRRGLALGLLVLVGVAVLIVAWVGLGRITPPIEPLPSGDPANGVTITNAIDDTVTVVYERPDGGTEQLVVLGPGQHTVIDSIFAERDGLCRTGRLVALTAAGAELDELYLVCRDRTWTVQSP